VVAKDLAAAQSAQTLYRDKLKGTPLAEIRRDPDLYRFALSAGGAAFQNNCAPCHGRGAQGFVGYPNLNDDDWLWGGSLEDIERTIRFGIRSDSHETRSSQMPRFGLDQLLSDKEIADVVEYVLSLSGKSEAREAIARGEKTFAEQCSTCHGGDGKGNAELGAPDLTDAIWLYGDSRQAVSESVRTGRGAVMPAWAGRLDAATLKALALYVHGLGGGK
jgi:cytochrome c oxidase cbb3-type subunit 3